MDVLPRTSDQALGLLIGEIKNRLDGEGSIFTVNDLHEMLAGLIELQNWRRAAEPIAHQASIEAWGIAWHFVSREWFEGAQKYPVNGVQVRTVMAIPDFLRPDFVGFTTRLIFNGEVIEVPRDRHRPYIGNRSGERAQGRWPKRNEHI